MIVCTPISRVQFDILEYVEGSGDGGRSCVYHVKESTSIIIREDR